MKILSARNGITVMSRSDGGITLEFEIHDRTVSLALLVPHEGWKGCSLAAWPTERKGEDLVTPNDDASAEEVAELLGRVLAERI